MTLPFPFGTLVYADASVFGGFFDPEFEADTRAFFELAKTGRFRLTTAPLLYEELRLAPLRVLNLYLDSCHVPDSELGESEVLALQQGYLAHGIVGRKSNADALHVASATLLGCKLIVSWNFRHIVHFQKIPQYNAVNQLLGYNPLAIHSPSEVIR